MELVSGMAGTMVVSTGFFAGALRAVAVLQRSPAEQVEWMTAVGFVGGAVLGAFIFILDLVLR